MSIAEGTSNGEPVTAGELSRRLRLGVRMGATLEGVPDADRARCAEIVEMRSGSMNGARRAVPGSTP